MEIPKKKIKAESQSPDRLLLYSLPKTGKTSVVAQLEDCLIIDLEEGTKKVDSLHMRANNPRELQAVVKALSEEKAKTGKNPFRYIAIDTATKLEEFAEEIAVTLYQASPMGKSFKGGPLELKALPMGAGYGYIRRAYKMMVNSIAPLCDRLILIGHTKDKYIQKDDKEVVAVEVDLSGKLSQIVTQNVDAIGYVYRKKNQLFVSFKTDGDIITGNRSFHLSGKDILLSESNPETGEITTYWDRIYID